MKNLSTTQLRFNIERSFREMILKSSVITLSMNRVRVRIHLLSHFETALCIFAAVHRTLPGRHRSDIIFE